MSMIGNIVTVSMREKMFDYIFSFNSANDSVVCHWFVLWIQPIKEVLKCLWSYPWLSSAYWGTEVFSRLIERFHDFSAVSGSGLILDIGDEQLRKLSDHEFLPIAVPSISYDMIFILWTLCSEKRTITQWNGSQNICSCLISLTVKHILRRDVTYWGFY